MRPATAAELAQGRSLLARVLDLPSGLPMGSPVEVTFELDEQGRLHVRAVEVTNGREVKVDIETELGASEEELQAAVARSQSLTVS